MKTSYAIPALLLLAACEVPGVKVSEQDGVQVTAPDGAKVSITEQGGVSVTGGAGQAIAQVGGRLAELTEKSRTDIASLAVAYPGARQVEVSGDWKLFGSDPGPRVTTEFSTSDSPEKVAAYYDAKMKALGVTPIVSAEADGGIARVVSTNNGAAVVAIGIEPKDGATRIRIEKKIDKAALVTMAG